MKKVLHSVAQALAATNVAPEWLHLIPSGTFTGFDGRGPYTVGNVEALMAASMRGGRKLPIDENHAIDLLGPKGASTPARGWIIALESRADGIWGKVDWTPEGKRLMEERAYGFISPALMSKRATPGIVEQILRASLVNDPNLTDLKSLHQPEETDMEEELRQALGLPETADKGAILSAVTALHSASTAQAALMSRIAEAAGTKKDASTDELVTAIHSRGAGGADAAALQSQVTTLHAQLSQLTISTAKEKAETAIGAAIAGGKLVPALRDHFIARHMKDPAEVEKELGLMLSLNSGGLRNFRPSSGDDGNGLSAEDAEVCALMGVDPDAFAKTAKTITTGAF